MCVDCCLNEFYQDSGTYLLSLAPCFGWLTWLWLLNLLQLLLLIHPYLCIPKAGYGFFCDN